MTTETDTIETKKETDVCTTLIPSPVEPLVSQCADKRKSYRAKCEQRWYGIALRDALANWKLWKEMDDYLRTAMREYLRNSGQVDISGKYHNPDHTLTGFLWNCQAALQKSKSSLYPFSDFEEHYQKIFLKRGLLIYCESILRELETESEKPLPLFEDGASG